MIRTVIVIGLAVVAICAIAVSFAGLYGLAVLCKFPPLMAALVPVLVDAGAGVATAVWLAGDVPRTARVYARCLALGLLAVSVAGNAGSHALTAAGASPSWVVVVLVGALAPAVLAAVTHLSALVKAGGGQVTERESNLQADPIGSREMTPTELCRDEPSDAGGDEVAPELATAGDGMAAASEGEDDGDLDPMEKARQLAAAGAGRPTLVALGLTHHQAKQVLRQVRQEATG